jgi:hypothetical protein
MVVYEKRKEKHNESLLCYNKVLCTGKEKQIKGSLEVQKMLHEVHKTSEEVSISFSCLQFGDHMRPSIGSLCNKPLSLWPLDDNTSPWRLFSSSCLSLFLAFWYLRTNLLQVTSMDYFPLLFFAVFVAFLHLRTNLCQVTSFKYEKSGFLKKFSMRFL